MEVRNNTNNPAFGKAVLIRIHKDCGCPFSISHTAMDYAINVQKAIGKKGAIPVEVPGNKYHRLIVNGKDRKLLDDLYKKTKETKGFWKTLAAIDKYEKAIKQIIKNKNTKSFDYNG